MGLGEHPMWNYPESLAFTDLPYGYWNYPSPTSSGIPIIRNLTAWLATHKGDRFGFKFYREESSRGTPR